MSLHPHPVRRLFPPDSKEDTLAIPDGEAENSMEARRESVSPEHALVETYEMISETDKTTPAPAEHRTALQPPSKARGRGAGRPAKRQKTIAGEQTPPIAQVTEQVGDQEDIVVSTQLDPDSARKTFIKQFGAEKGLTASMLESIWTARKHGYHKPYDAPFAKFQTFFHQNRPSCPFRPDTIQPGDVIGFLSQMQEEGSNHGSIKDASASIATAISQATDGAINIGRKDSVIAFLKSVRIHQPVGPRRKRIPDGYEDVARLYEEAWSFGPNEALCNRHLQDKLVLLLMVDTAARPSDLKQLYRVTEGTQRQIIFNGKDMMIRYFYSKEVDPGSARQNSSNTYFSSWVPVFGTTPIEINTVEVMKDFLRRTTNAQLYQQVHVPQLEQTCQPLVFSTSRQGKMKAASVDYISHIVRDAIVRMGMGNMQTAHIRGASTSKVVQLVPTAEAAIMKLGRWTTPYTFRNHYQAPVRGTWEEFPEHLQQNTQMILRWGFKKTPPRGVSAADYVKGPQFWVGKFIRNLGNIVAYDLDTGLYKVENPSEEYLHWTLMLAISEARIK